MVGVAASVVDSGVSDEIKRKRSAMTDILMLIPRSGPKRKKELRERLRAISEEIKALEAKLDKEK